MLDEAHRLRNVYKPTNVIANTLKLALGNKPKLLLTATPLQNSLLELFGLVSFVDEHAFGDLKSFREQFSNLSQSQVFETLKARLKPVCHRTLRRQVTAYVPFTKRHAMVEPFDPDEAEDKLYHLVSEYLRRDNLQALPASQRSLMTLVLRKLLASPSFAIAGALTTITNRLKAQIKKENPGLPLEEELDADYEALDETAEEWDDDDPAAPLSDADRAALQAEIVDLEEFTRLALSIDHNAKGKALLKALEVAFAKAREFGAAEKAIIFTESRKTQSYLLRLLADSAYAEGIVLFNGTNTDDTSRAIYARWVERHQGSDKITGSRSADMRSALVDYFRDEGRIMIATEAGAEGRRKLLENFDDEVREKLRIRDETSRATLNRFEQQLMQLTRHELRGHAEFPDDYSFRLHSPPCEGDIPCGLYELPRRSGEAHTYRLGHPLAEALIAQAKARALTLAEVEFRYADHGSKISSLEPLRGRAGWFVVSVFNPRITGGKGGSPYSCRPHRCQSGTGRRPGGAPAFAAGVGFRSDSRSSGARGSAGRHVAEKIGDPAARHGAQRPVLRSGSGETGWLGG